MCSWQVAVPVSGPCARPLIIIEHDPQIPSRQSWSNATGSWPTASSCSLRTSNTAKKHGKTATFMPKPLFQDNGSGMHVHTSLWKNGVNLFAGSGYAGLSDMGLYAIGGLLSHAPALCAFTNPTTNSYKRLVPGYEAPVNLAYSRRNRSASIRIPVYSPNPKAKRIEFRCPDGSSNPYLVFAAMLMAMIDGIKNKIKPGEPLDKDIYDLEPEELAKVPKAPGSLDEALTMPGEGPRVPAARRRLHRRT